MLDDNPNRSKSARKDCCELCAEADRPGGCQHEHAKGKGMIARCAPPGTRATDGCDSCVPCDGFHLRGRAYFATAADRLFKERDRFKPVRHQRPHDKRKHSRAQSLSDAIDRAQDERGERA